MGVLVVVSGEGLAGKPVGLRAERWRGHPGGASMRNSGTSGRWADYWAAFQDPQVFLGRKFFAWSVGIYGLNMWLPVITRARIKMGMANGGLLNAIPYLCGVMAMLVASTASDRTLKRKPFVWPFLFIGAAAFPRVLSRRSTTCLAFLGLIVAATCMYAPYGPFWAMTPEMVSRNVIGEAMALIITVCAAGGLLGTYGVGDLHRLTGPATRELPPPASPPAWPPRGALTLAVAASSPSTLIGDLKRRPVRILTANVRALAIAAIPRFSPSQRESGEFIVLMLLLRGIFRPYRTLPLPWRFPIDSPSGENPQK